MTPLPTRCLGAPLPCVFSLLALSCGQTQSGSPGDSPDAGSFMLDGGASGGTDGGSVDAGPGPLRAPNVLLIFADDLGYGHLGSYGQSEVLTPNLDRLAAEGARFSQFYSGGPWCPPARTSLLTGLHTGHTPLRGAGIFSGDEQLLPAAFRDAGYRTALFGKWGFQTHNGGENILGATPFELGFDEFVGFLTHRDAHVYYLDGTSATGPNPVLQTLFTGDGLGTDLAPLPVAPDRYLPDEFLARTLSFLDENRAQPFFVFFPTQLPHAELVAPPEGLAPYVVDGVSRFDEVRFDGNPTYPEPVEQPYATLAAMISRLDRDVGLLLDRLDELGLADDTLVLFTSDNGPHAAGGVVDHALLEGSGNLSGRKFDLLEGGLRVPFLARWPGHIPPGLVVEEPYALWDLDATLRELIEQPKDSPADGISLLAAWQGIGAPAHAALYFETYALGGQTLLDDDGRPLAQRAALRVGEDKLIRVQSHDGSDYVLLFDLSDDQAETTARDGSADPSRCSTLIELTTRMNAAHVDVDGGELPPLRALCQVAGTVGADVLDGTDGSERLLGHAGADVMRGLGGDDELFGGPGDDELNGNQGDDLVAGGDGDDVVRGGQGNDTVRGGAGADVLYGDVGSDRLFGGAGDDVAYGGEGDDIYVYESGDGTLTIFAEGLGFDRLECTDAYRISARVEGNDLVLSMSDGGVIVIIDDELQGNVTIDESCTTP